VALAALADAPEKKAGYSHAAAALSAGGIRTPRGGQWTRAVVRSLILRHQAQLPARREQ
jgi:hypothetical protein